MNHFNQQKPVNVNELLAMIDQRKRDRNSSQRTKLDRESFQAMVEWAKRRERGLKTN
jgi:hypothetical protein